jgi:RHS repeat-associated protein
MSTNNNSHPLNPPRQGKKSVGDPVDVASGTLFQSQDSEDYTLAGSQPIVITRRYSTALLGSNKDADGFFGLGWHSDLEIKLLRDLDGYRLTDPSGESEIIFDITPEELLQGKCVVSLGSFADLQQINNEICVTRWNTDTGKIVRDFFVLTDSEVWQPILRREDAENNVIEFIYSENSGLLREIRQVREQRGFVFQYNEDYRLVNIFRKTLATKDNKNGIETSPFLQYDYDDNGYLCQFTDPLGHQAHYEYDDKGQLIRQLTLAGKEFRFIFDAQGRCVVTSAKNRFDYHKLDYDPIAKITRETDSIGNITTYYYNDAGQVEKQISSLGFETQTQFDDEGRIIAEITAEGYATRYEYDKYGNRCRIIHPDGSSVHYHFNKRHQPISITDPLGHCWTREYDHQGRLKQQTNPHQVSQHFVYNDQGDLIEHRDGTGNQRYFVWDAQANLIRVSDWEAHYTEYEWDDFGNVIAFTDATGHKTQVTRDRLGRAEQLLLPDGNTRQYVWDVFNNLTRYTDERKITTQWQYCDCGNLEMEYKADGAKIGFAWNTIPGQLLKLTNENAEVYHFEYDADGRLVSETDFSGAKTQYIYNESNQIAEVIKPSEKTTQYQYDEVGRLLKIEHDDDSIITYDYDQRGLITSANNGDCPLTFDYDALGRLTHETQGDHELWHEYDALNQRIERRSGLKGTDITAFDWTANGQIEAVLPQGFDPIRFDYDPRGFEQQRHFGSHLSLHSNTDLRGRLAEQRLEVNTTYERTIVQRSYHYDATSNLLEKRDSQWGSTHYTYDELERITQTLHPDQTAEQFGYDSADNIVHYAKGKTQSKTNTNGLQDLTGSNWHYKSGNRLVAQDNIQYEYDADGQLSKKIEPQGETLYFWNGSGQLTGLEKPNGEKWQYTYDALSRRVEKKGLGNHRQFAWDGDVVLYETLYPDTEQEKTHQWEFSPHDFSPLFKLEAGQQYFSINDQIGTPMELVSKDARIVWQQRGLTFGELNERQKNEIECPVRFQGQWEDNESGLYYNRFRYYDSISGRFISDDPIGLLGGINQQAYVHNPNGWVDSLGLTGDLGTIQKTVNSILTSHLSKIQAIDPNATIGYRGSAASGISKAHTSNPRSIDPNNFDVDAFIKSDFLAKDPTFTNRKRDASKIKGMAEIEASIDKQLRKALPNNKFKDEKFGFRIFSSHELDDLARKKDVQVRLGCTGNG